MKRQYIKSAEGDYIKIGNRIIPTNTMDMGYADIDTISRRGRQMYEDEQRQAAEAIRQQQLQAKRDTLAREYAEVESELESDLANLTYGVDMIDTYCNYFVPDSGKADTIGGEIARAMNRILYRSWNDGDMFYEGDGIGTCLSSVAYLCDESGCDSIISMFRRIADNQLEDKQYDDAIDKIAIKLANYLKENPNLFAEPNDVDSCNYPTYGYEDMEAEYDTDFQIPYKIGIMLDRGIIKENELIWDLEGWDLLRDAKEITIDMGLVNIYGLKSKYQVDEISEWIRRGGDDRWDDEVADEYGFDPDRDDSDN